jgi:hypothetical protein
MCTREPAHDEVQVGGFPGVVHPGSTIQSTIARAKDEDVRCPAAGPRFGQGPEEVHRRDGALESVQQQETGCTGGRPVGRIETSQLDLIAIGCGPALDARVDARRPPRELSPECLEVCTRYPPRRGVGMFAGATHE